MSSRAKPALRAASGIAALTISLHASQSLAAQDFFALPSDAAGTEPGDPFGPAPSPIASKAPLEGVMFADVSLNGEPQQGLAKLRWIEGKLAIEAAFAFSKGIIPGLPETDFILLETIAGARYQFDPVSLRLDLRLPLRSTGANLVALGNRLERAVEVDSDLAALIVDYDVFLQTDPGGTGISGLVRPQVAKGNLAASSAWRFASNGPVDTGVTRLDTAVTLRSPEHAASATLGDFVTQMPAGSRAVRMAGIRIGTDFSVRPDLVTQPLPDFVNAVAVPTGIDVIVNDRRIAEAEIQPGEFTVRDVPVPLGRSNVGVVVRDTLGREVIESVRFYSSRKLLAMGLVEAAANLGLIRRRYGVASDDYGDLAGSAMVRKGLNSRLTASVFGEASSGVYNIGFGGDLVVGTLGVVSVTLRASRASYFADGARSGGLVGVGFESVGPGVSYSIEYRKASRHYADIASANGDLAPPDLLAANIAFDLRQSGSLRFSAVSQQRRIERDLSGPVARTRLVSANFRQRFARRFDFTMDASYRHDNLSGSGWALLAGISVSLGGPRFGQVSYSHNGGQNYLQAGYFSPDMGPGDTGYSVSAAVGGVERVAASISRQEQWARFEAHGEIVNGSGAARMGLRGALVAVDGALFASRGNGESFILVDAGGIEGLDVQRENRFAGTTDRDGRLLIDQVPGYNTVKISVAPVDLPLNVTANAVEHYVAAAPQSVARVKLAVARYLAQVIRLTDPRGTVFAPGSRVISMPSRSEYIVGFDGIVELNRNLPDTHVEILEPDGSVCRADLVDLVIDDEDTVPELRCFIRSRSFAIGNPDATSAIPLPSAPRQREAWPAGQQ